MRTLPVCAGKQPKSEAHWEWAVYRNDDRMAGSGVRIIKICTTAMVVYPWDLCR